MSVAQVGMPQTKARVPSTGSSTQVKGERLPSPVLFAQNAVIRIARLDHLADDPFAGTVAFRYRVPHGPSFMSTCVLRRKKGRIRRQRPAPARSQNV